MDKTRTELLQMLDAITPDQRQVLEEGLGVQAYIAASPPGSYRSRLANAVLTCDDNEIFSAEFYWPKFDYRNTGYAYCRINERLLDEIRDEYSAFDKLIASEYERALPFIDDLSDPLEAA